MYASFDALYEAVEGGRRGSSGLRNRGRQHVAGEERRSRDCGRCGRHRVESHQPVFVAGDAADAPHRFAVPESDRHRADESVGSAPARRGVRRRDRLHRDRHSRAHRSAEAVRTVRHGASRPGVRRRKPIAGRSRRAARSAQRDEARGEHARAPFRATARRGRSARFAAGHRAGRPRRSAGMARHAARATAPVMAVAAPVRAQGGGYRRRGRNTGRVSRATAISPCCSSCWRRNRVMVAVRPAAVIRIRVDRWRSVFGSGRTDHHHPGTDERVVCGPERGQR